MDSTVPDRDDDQTPRCNQLLTGPTDRAREVR
jgi:hypothetical protein